MKAVLAGLGLATICLGWMLVPMLDPRHIALYHWYASSTLFYLPRILDFCLLWWLLSLLIFAAARFPVWGKLFWAFVVSFAPAVLMKCLSLGQYVAPSRTRGILLLIFGSICFCSLGYLWLFERVRSDRVIHVISTAVMLLGFSGAFFLAQLGWYWMHAGNLNPQSHTQTLTTTRPPHAPARIIWVVFDELSYQQVYGNRFAGLDLPAFDSLAREATVFSNVSPAGIETQKVLPALMTGEAVDDIRSSDAGALLTHSPSTGEWKHFDAHQTIFQDASNLGYKTAVVGWYNPYCRMLASLTSDCYWTFIDRNLSPSLAGNIVREMGNQFPRFFGKAGMFTQSREPGRDAGSPLAKADFAQLTSRASAALAKPEATFTFLHLPIPHPPGIYNRRTRTFVNGTGSYIDNLALADTYLAKMVAELKATGQWDSCVLVIMGDHSWRTLTSWRTSPWWTPEDEAASHGGIYDPRPGYIVKLAGQHTGARIDSPLPALRTRELLNGIMNGQIQTERQLADWAVKR